MVRQSQHSVTTSLILAVSTNKLAKIEIIIHNKAIAQSFTIQLKQKGCMYTVFPVEGWYDASSYMWYTLIFTILISTLHSVRECV